MSHDINYTSNYDVAYQHMTTTITAEDMATVKNHNHDSHEIYILISGKVNYFIEGNMYPLQPGDMLTIYNNDFHTANIEQNIPYERISIFVSHQFLSKYSTPQTDLNQYFLKYKNTKNHLTRPSEEYIHQIQKLINQIENSILSDAPGHDILINNAIAAMIIKLDAIHSLDIDRIEIEQDDIFIKILSYINEDLRRDLKLYTIAEKFFVSQFHLTRKFKEYTGYTFHQYVQNKRLVLARNLFQKGFSIKSVIEKCGFRDYSTFVRLFKQKYGVPPQKFIMNCKKDLYQIPNTDSSEEQP